MHLSTGERLDADALVCCTGWKTNSSIHLDFGPSTTGMLIDTDPEPVAAEREIYHDIRILRTLPPRTANAPVVQGHKSQNPTSPYQLYRMVVPSQPIFLENENIAFIGLHSSIHAVLVAQAQALWITAFFQDKVDHLSSSNIDFRAVKYNSILESVYRRLRRPKESGGAAGKYPDLVWDSLPYVDTLLGDLGLSPNRKSN